MLIMKTQVLKNQAKTLRLIEIENEIQRYNELLSEETN